VGETKFISSEPKLAIFLKKRKPLIVSETFYGWAVGWIEEVGTLIRSRSVIAGLAASIIYDAAVLGILRLSPFKIRLIREILK